ncbi:prenyl protein peptidase [Microthyrium microscopicum]|uniref:intramembrane prenyl-peptidase Rce1 n=1 Tax=Microthyrium microscopicum TaxID=703497 RepID=A0A6A6UKI9_9PEZI|nr:prenyl protein peptidase [Microthyrium microscopicum]
MAPIDLYKRIKAYYSGGTPNKPPAISTSTAAILSAAFVAFYVIPFYLSSTTKPSRTLSKDAPSVIRGRIRAITVSCTVSTLITVYILAQYNQDTLLEILRILGCWPIDLADIGKTLLLCSILFAGPIFDGAIVQKRLGLWLSGTLIRETFASWIGWRNYVAGPVSEELVWRSLIIPLHLVAKMSPTRIIFITPLYFGIAHVHHFYEFVLTHPELPLLPAVIRTIVQFAYTSLFGFFAAFVYLRTGSVYAATAAHVFCNWQGLPQFWGQLRVDAEEESSDEQEQDGNNGKNKRPQRHYAPVQYSIIYYMLLVGGAYGFKAMLWPLTNSSHALANVGSTKH